MDKKITKSLLYLAAAVIGSMLLLINIGFFLFYAASPKVEMDQVKELHQFESDLDYGAISEVTLQGKKQLLVVMKDGSTYKVHTDTSLDLANRIRQTKTRVNFEAEPSDNDSPFGFIPWALFCLAQLPVLILMAGLIIIARRIQPDSV